jgi:hypothetical protein
MMSTKSERKRAFQEELVAAIAADITRVDPELKLAIVDLPPAELLGYVKRRFDEAVPLASSGPIFGKTN